ncbi:MAG TPA: IS256 family transposase [Alphaproteobacteria bacterium]
MPKGRSKIREIIRGRTEELENLAVEMYARGLSTRDIEALFADDDGRSLLSRTAVSEITERLWAEYEAFAARDLSEFEVVYLFVDGIAERLHLGQPREAVLAAWGILADGKKALLHLAPGTKEDTASCREFFRDLRRRGLPDPVLVASDGAPGLIQAIEERFPHSSRQRCLAHKMRNLQSKVPKNAWPEFLARAQACYRAASPSLARLLRDDIAQTYGADLPSAVAGLDDDFEACIAHLKFPLAHRRAIRTTNLLERLFGEERRRTKVIPRLRRARRLEAHVCRADPRRRTMESDQNDRVRATSVAGRQGGARPHLRRANRTRSRHSPHRIPTAFIQQRPDLTYGWALSFGFCVAMLGPRYDASLWRPALRHAFPHRPKSVERKPIQKTLNSIRRLRNRVAHDEPILDRNLIADHNDIIQLVSWICPETANWVLTHSRALDVIAKGP